MSSIPTSNHADYSQQSNQWNPPLPSLEHIEACKSKNELLQQPQQHINRNNPESSNVPKYGSTWKDTVTILQQRLDLANKMKHKALHDGKKLQKQITKCDHKLKQLNVLQEKLQSLEAHYKSINDSRIKLQNTLSQTNDCVNA
eukprot:197610_1